MPSMHLYSRCVEASDLTIPLLVRYMTSSTAAKDCCPNMTTLSEIIRQKPPTQPLPLPVLAHIATGSNGSYRILFDSIAAQIMVHPKYEVAETLRFLHDIIFRFQSGHHETDGIFLDLMICASLWSSLIKLLQIDVCNDPDKTERMFPIVECLSITIKNGLERHPEEASIFVQLLMEQDVLGAIERSLPYCTHEHGVESKSLIFLSLSD